MLSEDGLPPASFHCVTRGSYHRGCCAPSIIYFSRADLQQLSLSFKLIRQTFLERAEEYTLQICCSSKKDTAKSWWEVTSQSTELFGKWASVVNPTSLVALLTSYLHVNITKMWGIKSVNMKDGIYSEIDSAILTHISKHKCVCRKGVVESLHRDLEYSLFGKDWMSPSIFQCMSSYKCQLPAILHGHSYSFYW